MDSSRSLRVLREFFFVPSVLDCLSSMTERERLNKITEAIIGAAIQVHRVLGPGLLESAYVACLAYELGKRGLVVEQQKAVPLVYGEVKLECGYRMDLLVQQSVVVEVKSIDALAPIHEAQTLSYLRLSGCKLALLINFQCNRAERRHPAVYQWDHLRASTPCLLLVRLGGGFAPANHLVLPPSGQEIQE